MRYIRSILFLFIALICFLWYSYLNLGNFLDITKEASKTELLVCLGGGHHKYRVDKTIQLYEDKYLESNYIIFTGIQKLDFIVNEILDSNINIEINKNVKNTMEEVLYVKEFIKTHNLKSVTFITEPPHSRRIKLFWDNFGLDMKDVEFKVVASRYDNWDKDLYYYNEYTKSYAFSEVSKIFYNFFVYGLLESIGLKDTFETYFYDEVKGIKHSIKF